MTQPTKDELLGHALASLPHGPEFRFIDRLLDLAPGERGTAEYVVPRDALFLRGHFPGQPLFPGVLLVEAAAQLAGIVAQSDPRIPPLLALKLTGFKNVKITGTALPGQTIRLEARVIGRLGNLVQASAEAWVANQSVLRAELILSGSPRDCSK
jgi:3-hydroxyacyl-[acyl-carrier-protein] dehydratase